MRFFVRGQRFGDIRWFESGGASRERRGISLVSSDHVIASDDGDGEDEEGHRLVHHHLEVPIGPLAWIKLTRARGPGDQLLGAPDRL